MQKNQDNWHNFSSESLLRIVLHVNVFSIRCTVLVVLIHNWLDKPWPACGGDVLQLFWAMCKWGAAVAQNGDKVCVEGFQGWLIGIVCALSAGDGLKICDEPSNDVCAENVVRCG